MSKLSGTGGKVRAMANAEADVAVAPVPQVATLPLWLVGALAALALAVMWLVGFDNGQLSGVLDGTGSYLHELFHDGRHVLGAPCH